MQKRYRTGRKKAATSGRNLLPRKSVESMEDWWAIEPECAAKRTTNLVSSPCPLHEASDKKTNFRLHVYPLLSVDTALVDADPVIVQSAGSTGKMLGRVQKKKARE